MTFLAVRRWFGWSSGRLLVVDIGGGSLELAAGLDEEPDVAISLPLAPGGSPASGCPATRPPRPAARGLRAPRPRRPSPSSVRPLAQGRHAGPGRRHLEDDALARPHRRGGAARATGPYVPRDPARATTSAASSAAHRPIDAAGAPALPGRLRRAGRASCSPARSWPRRRWTCSRSSGSTSARGRCARASSCAASTTCAEPADARTGDARPGREWTHDHPGRALSTASLYPDNAATAFATGGPARLRRGRGHGLDRPGDAGGRRAARARPSCTACRSSRCTRRPCCSPSGLGHRPVGQGRPLDRAGPRGRRRRRSCCTRPSAGSGEYAAGFVEGVALREHDSGIRLAVENMFPWRTARREMLGLPARTGTRSSSPTTT